VALIKPADESGLEAWKINKDQLQRHFVKRLQKLGFKVTLERSLEAA
jgi:hypothetical protein